MGRLPEVAVEGALAPEAAARRWEEELTVRTVEVDLGFEHPGEGCRDRHHAAGVGLAVGGAADLEDLAVEVFAALGNSSYLGRVLPHSEADKAPWTIGWLTALAFRR